MATLITNIVLNLQAPHILCLQETRIQSSCNVQKIVNITRYKYLFVSNGHGILVMCMYYSNMILQPYETHVCMDLDLL